MIASPTPSPRWRALPVLHSLRGYGRTSIGPDVLACITLLVIAVPEQLATSRLAGMPPITGLYTFIAGTLAIAVLGSSPQLSVGADSTIAPLFATGIAHLAPTASAHYVSLVSLLAVMVGVIVLLVGVLRMGWIADFLSAPIITGFLAGVAIIIIVHQLPDLLGIASASGSTAHRLASAAQHLRDTNGWTLGIGVAVFLVVVTAERIDRKLPGALFGMVGSTVIVALTGLKTHGVSVLGTVAHGAPHIGVSGVSWTSVAQLFPLAGVVALVVLSQTAATTRAFAAQGGYDVDVNRDFVGVGAGGVLAGLCGAFATDASPARTAAVASAGGRTQLAGLAAAGGVILLIPAAGLLTDVPLATLAAILVYVATRIFRVHDLLAVLRFDLFEFGLALVTLLTVAFIGVEQGIGVAVGLAILDRTRRSARPPVLVLGKIRGTTSWVPLSHRLQPEQVPGVVVLQLMAPLYYANADRFRIQVEKVLADAPTPPHVLILDGDAMGDIDFTGTRTVLTLLDEQHRAGIVLGVARAIAGAPRSLERSGLLDRIGRDHIFDTVDEAVAALRPASGAEPDTGPAAGPGAGPGPAPAPGT
ncbi:MAG: SulP family inorganic anion transporter [Acidimicrobiales bacterium]